MIDPNQLTLKDITSKTCRLWDNCSYRNCIDCDNYHNPTKHSRLATND